jgi:hypothetical protein
MSAGSAKNDSGRPLHADARQRPAPSEKSLANLIPFKPGQSGNPSGRRGDYFEALSIYRDAAPEAARVMVELLKSDDERVRMFASDKVMERAWGKPKQLSDSGPQSLANLPPEAQRRRVLELLAFAATLTIPGETIEGNVKSQSDITPGDVTSPEREAHRDPG